MREGRIPSVRVAKRVLCSLENNREDGLKLKTFDTPSGRELSR